MRSALLAAALLGLAAAAPRPQGIDFGSFDAAEEPEVQGPPAGATTDVIPIDKDEVVEELTATLVKRDVPPACLASSEPLGNGPTPSVDTPEAFSAYQDFSDIANSHEAPHPRSPYKRTFVNKDGSTHQNGYLGLHTLSEYSPHLCEAKCDQKEGCVSFNIFFERNPKYTPNSECPNPPSTTNIKCTLWGFPIAAGSAVNKGQTRQQFKVVIAGSNGYTKPASASPIAKFTGPVSLPGAINEPSGAKSYIRTQTFKTSGYFMPELCASGCETMTAYNSRHRKPDGTYVPCNFFNAYVLTTNGVGEATVCAYYTKEWSSEYAVNKGQWRGADFYGVTNSFSYALTTPHLGGKASISGAQQR
ncbi:hypothetical protein H2201_000071 [Coniosporium apollinis]|uniref:Apple domain-containing protein n=1 Tax=Coniosporium apollinis TaxID=61459 RepID=A0ABQ9P5R3_9PEZI|nr:hypothetical protein H2201_000071 [Coniosporium apollinis]